MMKKMNLLATLIILIGMVGLAECLHEKEIIFPEILALLIGALLMPKQPWKVNRFKLVSLMSLSAIMGVIIVRYIPLPVWLQIGFAFCFTAISLMLSKTTLVPMISACILPILLKTTTWIYPLSVFLLCLSIVLMQWGLEKLGCREKSIYEPVTFEWRKESMGWLKRLGGFLLIALLPCLTEDYYFIAPPLIVSFVELSKPTHKLRKVPLKLILLITLSSVLGMAFRLIVVQHFALSLTLASLLATLSTLLLMKKMDLFFPPAGALAILPMILPAPYLIYYPLKVCVGICLFTGIALWHFPTPTIEFQEQNEAIN